MAQQTFAHSGEVGILRIADGLPDALYCIEAASGEYTYVNPAFEALTGYSLHEIRTMGGRGAFDAATRTSVATSTGLAGDVSASGAPTIADDERWFKRKDGTVICLEDRSGTITENGLIVAYTGVLRDVTDRKAWEFETVEKMSLLRMVVDSLPDIVYAKDRQGRKLLSNLTEVRDYLHCSSEDEVLGKDDFAFYDRELATEFMRLDQEVLSTGRPILNHEMTIVDRAGVQRWVVSTKVPFRDPSGNIAGLVGIGRDISARHQAEDSMRLFRALVDHANDAIIVLDPQSGRMLDANDTALRIFGYDREEFLKRSLLDIDSNLDRRGYEDLLVRLADTGGVIISRTQRRRDRSTFPSEVSVNVVHLDREYVVATIRDISRRMKEQEALRKSEERFRLVTENVADLLALLHEDGLCEFASPSHLRDGHSPDSLMGQDYLALIHPGDVPRVRDCLAMVARGSGHQSIEFRLRNGDGFWRFKDASVTLIVDDAGERLLLMARDMTERKLQEESQQWLERQLSERNAVLEKALAEVRQMQQGLIQSEKMASIGQLTAGIAHEINNPLAFVSSNLNRFGEYFNDVLGVLKTWDAVKGELEKDPQFQPLLALVRKAEEQADLEFAVSNFPVLMTHTSEGTERIRSIVDRLRGFSHMATESFADADINAALDDTINLTWNELKYKATIVKEYGELPRVSCNVGEIKQVLVNLLVNAAQALKDKGTITLRTKEGAGMVVIQVIDTGGGIPEANLKRIFDPFFTTKAVGKGTGLGLWISATIIQKHGGTLAVDSVEGTGTTMTITLPVSHDVTAGEAA